MVAVKIVGNSGAVQIDEQWCNYMVIASGTLAASTDFIIRTVTVNGVAPMIVWAGDLWGVCLNTSVSGSAWTFRIATYGTGSLTWYALDQGVTLSSGPAMRVRRPSDGALIFDSGSPFAIVQDAIENFPTLTATSGAVSTYPYVSGRKYAVSNLQNPYAASIVATPGTPEDPRPRIQQVMKYLMCRGQTAQAQVMSITKSNTAFIADGNNTPAAGSYGASGSVLVLDVTNF